MAWTSVGFDGTINEAQWSQMAGLLGNDYVAAGNSDCLVTAVGGARSVSVAAGSLYGDGVVSTNSAPETVAMTTPVNGQWYVIALRRTWATNTAALVAIAGATTTTTTPTAPPTSFPTLNTNKGVLTDQPIAWAWCNSANTTVVVYDIRLKAVKSLPPVVANGTERDAKFMTPFQGLQVWRDDLGAVETYFGLYNSSTNPGGRDTAGWYVNDRQTGLIPIKPSNITVVSGSGSMDSLGKITVSGATILAVDGVFSSKYKNYRVIIEQANSVGGTANWIGLRMRSAGSNNDSSNYYAGGFYTQGASINAYNMSSGSYFESVFVTNDSRGWGYAVIEFSNPANASYPTTFHNTLSGFNVSANFNQVTGGFHNVGAAFDGFSLLALSNTFNAVVSIYGVN